MESGRVLRADCVITPDQELTPGWVLVEEGKVKDLGEGLGPESGEVVTLAGLTLVPGFVELHVHGGGGFSFDSGIASDVGGYRRWVVSTGVTSFLATVIGGSVEGGLRSLKAIVEAKVETADGAEVLGFNLEGPFLNAERPGAIPPLWITAPDVETFESLFGASGGLLRLMTVAPEVMGAGEVIRAARDRGVAISVGHSDAIYDEAASAFENGATHVTHAFNGMRPYHHREPGIVGAALDSEGVTIEVIADGVHLHRGAISMLVSAFGTERVSLVTDATSLAGGTEGSVQLGGREATLREGRVTLADGTIAGSAATMDALIRNVVGWGVTDLAGAVRMASTVPSKVAGAGDRKGRIDRGYDADLVALDAGLKVVKTWTGGVLRHEVKMR